jgi:hypothetical protein
MGVGQFIAEKHNAGDGGGPMKGHENGHAKLKERAIEELKEFWITSLYLFIFQRFTAEWFSRSLASRIFITGLLSSRPSSLPRSS